MDCSPPASSVHGILQAGIQEWVVIPFSRVSSWPRDQTQVSHTVGRFFTVWATRKIQLLAFCPLTPMGLPWLLRGKESTCNAGDPSSILKLGRSPGEGIGYPFQYYWTSLVAQLVKNPPAMQETWVWFLIWEDPLEKGKATHFFWPGEFHGVTSRTRLSDFHFHPLMLGLELCKLHFCFAHSLSPSTGGDRGTL